jgi:hypothetical protein
MLTPKIYISSTYYDLQEHRSVLISALRKTECFQVVSMESYGTVSQRPLDKCLADVKEAEFYILLLGNRYGFIPEGHKYSITNLEYKVAIGDTAADAVAQQPDYKRCVLPFIINENYAYPQEIIEKINTEEQGEGLELTKQKAGYLKELKKRVQSDFTIDNSFTSPADLVNKVFGALIPALIGRKYASLVNNIMAPEGIAYRCNRDAARNEFLYRNFLSTGFYRVFIVHGEIPELPIIFSNNIQKYELNARENSTVHNLEDYVSNNPERFLQKLTRDLHHNIFRLWPEKDSFSLQDLAGKIIADEQLHSIVVTFDISYRSWKDKYKGRLTLFFDEIEKANQHIRSQKNCYFLINIKYDSPKENLNKVHKSTFLLDKLANIQTSHIEQWVRTHFLNTDKTRMTRNRVEIVARKITGYYFPDQPNSRKGMSMEYTIGRLENIVSDFNNNRNLFDDYSKLLD